MAGIFFVRNIEQQAAFLELDGQISDGYWENASGRYGWQAWVTCEVRVTDNVFELGRTFAARKDNFNFAAPALLDVVGKRMLGIVRIARAFGIDVASQLEHEVNCDTGLITAPCTPTGHEAEWSAKYHEQRNAKFAALAAAGITFDALTAALQDPSYSMVMLRADLVDLKRSAKRYVPFAAPEAKAAKALQAAYEAGKVAEQAELDAAMAIDLQF